MRHKPNLSLGAMVFFQCILLVLPARSVPAQEASPLQVVRQFHENLALMRFPVEDEDRHEALLEQNRGLLDLQGMLIEALGEYWQEASAGQREEFMALMWGLIENIAYKRSSSFLQEADISYSGPRRENDGFTVRAVLEQEEQVIPMEAVYHLGEKEGRLKITDIVIDEVSLTQDFEHQFREILEEEGFSGLLQHMRERLRKAQGRDGDAS